VNFDETFEFIPAEGCFNAFVIRPNKIASDSAVEKMTAEDWNKFEKDIADAFEKIPWAAAPDQSAD
jgi:hypothetical protein